MRAWIQIVLQIQYERLNMVWTVGVLRSHRTVVPTEKPEIAR
jgi:hypothetical protein